jgi:hypothetical protein
MSKARRGDRRSAAAMVRAAEGPQVRPSAARVDAAGIDDDAVAVTAPASSEAGASDAGAAADRSTSDLDCGAQGNLPLPAERRRWDSLVSYPGDAGAASAGMPADAAPASPG